MRTRVTECETNIWNHTGHHKTILSRMHVKCATIRLEFKRNSSRPNNSSYPAKCKLYLFTEMPLSKWILLRHFGFQILWTYAPRLHSYQSRSVVRLFWLQSFISSKNDLNTYDRLLFSVGATVQKAGPFALVTTVFTIDRTDNRKPP